MTEEQKVIYVEYNGYEWWFPARYVAKDKADYYAKKGESYQEEFDTAMSDDDSLLDWFLGDMNWSDVSKYARLSKQPFILEPDMTEASVRVSEREY